MAGRLTRKTKRGAKRILPEPLIDLLRQAVRRVPSPVSSAEPSSDSAAGIAREIEQLEHALRDTGDRSSRDRLNEYTSTESTPTQARQYAGLALGRWLLQQGDFAAALAPLETSYAFTDRLDVPTTSFLADALSRAGRSEEALAKLAPLVYRREADPSTLIRIGCVRARIEEDLGHGSGPVVEALNRIYAQYGYSLLHRGDVSRPVSLANIFSAAPTHEPLEAEPRVSVFVPSRRATDLAPALQSLARQTWRNLEIIVTAPAAELAGVRQRLEPVSDGTTNLRIEVWDDDRDWPDLAFETASGEFLLIHEPTEWSHPQRIQLQATALTANPEIVEAGTSFIRFDEEWYPRIGNWTTAAVVAGGSPPMLRRSVDERPDVQRFQGSTQWLEPQVPMSLLRSEPIFARFQNSIVLPDGPTDRE